MDEPRKPLYPLREEERVRRLRARGLDSSLVPLTATVEEWKAAQNPGLPDKKKVTMEPSPTGTPWLSTKLVPFLTAFGAVAFLVAEIAADNTIADSVAKKVLALLALAGISSPGWRKPPELDGDK